MSLAINSSGKSNYIAMRILGVNNHVLFAYAEDFLQSYYPLFLVTVTSRLCVSSWPSSGSQASPVRGLMNHDQVVQRHASVSPNFPSRRSHTPQPLIAQANQVICKFLHSRCSVTCYDIFTVMGDEDSLCGFADDNAFPALEVSVY